jgi:hypothetical protein
MEEIEKTAEYHVGEGVYPFFACQLEFWKGRRKTTYITERGERID